MLELTTFSEADLYALLPANNVKKGFTYLNAILQPVRSGDTLKAMVLDRQRHSVEVEMAPTGLHISCTCGFYGRGCKHCAALLLKWLHSPEAFTQQEEPGSTLENSTVPLRVIPVPAPPTQRPEELPAWRQATWAERLQSDRQDFEELLNLLRLDDLRALARAHHWTVRGTRKADVVAQLTTQLLQSNQLEEILHALDQEHRQALRAIAILGIFPAIPIEQMEALAKFWGQLKQYSKFSTYVRHLTEKGLIISVEQMGDYVYGLGVAAVPTAVARLLPPLLADALPAHRDLEAATTRATAQASGLQVADPDWLVRTVTQLLVVLEQTTYPLRPPLPRPYREKVYTHLQEWDYVPEEIYTLEKQGKSYNAYQAVSLTVPPPQYPLPDEAMAGLLPLVGDANRLEFLYQLMVTAGLLQPGSPVTVWPEGKEQFLRQPVATQQAILTRAYFDMNNWSELWSMLRSDPALKLVRSAYLYNTGYLPHNLRTELAAFRTLILTTCAWLPDDRWISLSDLMELLRQIWPQFNQLFWQQRYNVMSGPVNRGYWHLTYRDKALDSKTVAEWEQVQGRFIHTLLSGPLHWAGLVDLYAEAGQLTAVRFHGLGDLYWDRAESVTRRRLGGQPIPARPSATTAELLHIAGDEITVEPARITAQAHSLLDRIATLAVAQAQQFIYRLDAATVQKSFEAGLTLTELLTEWEVRLSKPIPAPIKDRLSLWWAAYGQLRLYQDVTIIEFGDDHALTEMKAVTSLNSVLIAEISPRLVLIPKSAVTILATELAKAGYTPQQTETTD